MKKKTVLLGIGVMLVFGMVLLGCGDGAGDGGDNNQTPAAPTTATITITNGSDQWEIKQIVVTDADTTNAVATENGTLSTKGGSKSITVDPGKYTVTITDSSNYSYKSPQFTLAAGGSKTLTFTGTSLY
jgi:hypothetical protein